MTGTPLVSVVIPCINRAPFLRPTIDSALGQDYPQVECIVVDGGSTDGSLDILREYGDRIRWISEPDRGHADAINKGWRLSRGEILAWLNADDLWIAPGAVSAAMSHLAAHPETDVVFGECEAVDLEGRFLAMSYGRDWDLEHAVVHCDYCIPQPTSFMRRSILERVGWLDEAFVSKKDHELWLRIGLAGRIERLPIVLARERIGPGYLAARGDITARACVQLTRKFFTLPGVPEGLRRQRRRALSTAHAEGMKWAWECGRHWSTVLAFAARAVAIDPSNAREVLGRLRWYLAADAPRGRRFRYPLALYRLMERATARVRG